MNKRTVETQSRRLLWLIVIGLLALWAVLAGLRAWAKSEEAAALGDRLWDVNIAVRVENARRGTLGTVALPLSTNHLRTIGQQSLHTGWSQRSVTRSPEGGARRIRLVATGDGQLEFGVKFTVHQSAAPLITSPLPVKGLAVDQLEKYLGSRPLLGLEHEIVAGEAGLLAVGSQSQTEVLDRIVRRAHQLLPRANGAPRAVPEVLASGRASVLERAYSMIALSRASHIPARLVTGLVLAESREVHLHYWVEVYDDGAEEWMAYDPLQGYRQGVPNNYLPFIKGAGELVTVEGAGVVSTSLSIANADDLLDVKVGADRDWRALFYLTRLPLEMRSALAILLLMPLAVLLSMAFREITGIHSYGIFTPTLFALILTHASWQTAGITMGMVLLFGVLGRLAMPAELKRSPRLTVVMTLVALGTVVSISVIDYFAWTPDGQVVLLSIVILATMVDRIYKTLDTEGLHRVVVRLGWTLFQAVFLCLPVLRYEALGHLLVAYPETHLLTLVAVLLVSAYQGVRLAELPRLRWLNPPPGRKKASEKEDSAD